MYNVDKEKTCIVYDVCSLIGSGILHSNIMTVHITNVLPNYIYKYISVIVYLFNVAE